MKTNILKASAFLLLVAGITSCNNDMEYADVNTTPVALFYEPINGKAVKLVASNSASLLFEWEASHSESGAVPQYEVAFYSPNDTQTPIYKVVSDNTGTKPMATISHKTLAKVCAAAGIAGGETGTVKWGVIAYAGVNPSKSTIQNDLTLTRFEGFAEIPTALYFGGTASETGGDDLSNAIALNAIDAETYEAFTYIKGNGELYLSADRDGATTYSLNGNKIIEDRGGNSGITEDGVYRVVLDFGAATASVKKIDKFYLYHTDRSNFSDNDDFELPYVGNGVFQAKDAIFKLYETGWSWDPFESRYNFKMEYADGSKVTWGPVNAGEDGKPSGMDITSSYFRMTEYDGGAENKWKLYGSEVDSEFVGKPTTYTVYFNLDNGAYTHFYE